jgi:GNAT superfamily N-acetyltransferase
MNKKGKEKTKIDRVSLNEEKMCKETMKAGAEFYPAMNGVKKWIYDCVVEHDWEYKGEVISELIVSLIGIPTMSKKNGGEVKKHYRTLKINGDILAGFVILSEYPDTAGEYTAGEIDYIFILPQYRRFGIATTYITRCKTHFKKICVSTKEDPMKRCLEKLDFKFDRMCDNGREESWMWLDN